jgi:tRNA G26 N,N-dimethylase Trm1
MTNLQSIGEIEKIRKILDAEREVDYWYLDINSLDNKLTIMGSNIEKVVNKLKAEGLIVEVD